MANVIAEFLIGVGYKTNDPELAKAEKQGKDAGKRVEKQWKKTGLSIGKSLLAFGTALTGAGIGLFKFVDKVTATADATAKAARAAGIASDSYQKLEFAAERSGVPMKTLTKASDRLAKSFTEVAIGSGEIFVDLLDELNISFGELKAAKPEEQFAIIADALQDMTTAERVGALATLFGGKGTQLASLLAEGGEGIRQLAAEAEALGIILDTDALDAAEEFQDRLTDLKATVKGVFREVAISAIPTIRDFVIHLQSWFNANRDLLKQRLKQFIAQVSKAVKDFTPLVVAVVKIFGTLIRLAADLTAALGPAGLAGVFVGLKVGFALMGSATFGPMGALIAGFTLLLPLAISFGKKLGEIAFQATEAGEALEKLKDITGTDLGRGGGSVLLKDAPRLAELAVIRKNIVRVRQEFLDAHEEDFRPRIGGRGIETRATDLPRLNKLLKSINNELAVVDQEIKDETAAGRKRAKQRKKDAAEELAQPPGVPAGPPGRGKGKPAPEISPEEQAAFEKAIGIFGEEFKRLGERVGATTRQVSLAIEASALSLLGDFSDKVAREAGIAKLSSLTGEPISTARERTLAELVGGDPGQPDVQIGEITKGLQPQVLVSNITNNFTFDIDQEINGVGEPGQVGDSIVRSFRDLFQNQISKATKTAKVSFAR